MKTHLLDMTVLAALLNGRPAAVTLLSPLLTQHELATSMIVYGEVTEFIQGYTNAAQRQQDLETLLADIYSYNLTYGVLQRYATLRRAMRRPTGSGVIGDMDTLIAATAIEYSLTLVTVDSDFERVPGLSLLRMDRASLKK